MSTEFTEGQEIARATAEIRMRELNLKKRWSFDLKFTYWDADDLSFQMKTQRLSSIILKRLYGDIAISIGPKVSGKFTVRPDQLVELFVMDIGSINTVVMTNGEFEDVGGVEMYSLTSPGIDVMEKWCNGIDAEIIRVAKDLKKRLDVKEIFKKIWTEMGGSTAQPHDRVVKRVDYIRRMTEAFRSNEKFWYPEMKRIGLKS